MRLLLAIIALLIAQQTTARAACDPSGAAPSSYGCLPDLPSALTSTDYLIAWRPSLGASAARKVTGALVFSGGFPGVFSSLTVTGAGSIGAALSVATSLSVGTTAAIAGNATVGGTLGAVGAFTASSTSTHVGAAVFSSTVGIAGNVAVATNKFTVNATTGDTVAAGSLLIGGGIGTTTAVMTGAVTAGSYLSTGATASVSTCGSGASVVGNGTAGKITIGTGGVSGCTVTFGITYATAPVCTGNTFNGPIANLPTATSTSTSTTQLVLAFGAAVGNSSNATYHCIQ